MTLIIFDEEYRSYNTSLLSVICPSVTSVSYDPIISSASHAKTSLVYDTALLRMKLLRAFVFVIC
jgi:hypothetical protein